MSLRILVPLGGSEEDEQVLEAAAFFADAARAQVCLLRVVPPARAVTQPSPYFDMHQMDEAGQLVMHSNAGPVVQVENVMQADERQKAEAHDYLARVASRFPNSTVECLVRVGAHAAGEICRSAEEQAVNMIVMAGHGHTRLTRAIAASVTEEVVHSGKVPVLIVPPGDQ